VPEALVFEAPLVLQRTDAGAVSREGVTALRGRLGLAPEDVVVGAFGLLTREKRLDAVAQAVARASTRDPRLRLLLAGPVGDRPALEAQLAAHGLRGRAIVTGRVPLAELPTHIEAADIVVHLRWPTGRESSAALLRVLAQGRPVIATDLRQQSMIPAEALRRVDPSAEETSLEREILALAADPGLRARIGAAGAAHVHRAHSPAVVLDAWEHALEGTRRAPDPPAHPWPRHWPRAGFR
jgi:glycosyltransferase involved in cell wall biosynthesis